MGSTEIFPHQACLLWLCKLPIVLKALSEFTLLDPWIGSLQEHPV